MKKISQGSKNDIEVIDDFLPFDIWTQLDEMFGYNQNIGWVKDIVINEELETNKGLLCDEKYNVQYVHWLYNFHAARGVCDDVMGHFGDKLAWRALLRAKVNWTQCTEEIQEYGYHVDYPWDHQTAIYYFNTNDGYTKFQKCGTKVASKANRLIKIPTSLYHTGTTCTNGSGMKAEPNKGRYVLNINYIR